MGAETECLENGFDGNNIPQKEPEQENLNISEDDNEQDMARFQALEAKLRTDVQDGECNVKFWAFIALAAFLFSIPLAIFMSSCWSNAEVGVHFHIWTPVFLSAVVLIWFVSSVYDKYSAN